MNVGSVRMEWKQRTRLLRLKEAVFASFCEPASSVRARLNEFTTNDWTRAKYWLGVSGLALYFLDRLASLGVEDSIPDSLLTQLRNDLAGNQKRMAWFYEESAAVAQKLGNLGIDFAFLKGLTLPSESVTERALRDQTDIDIMVRERNVRAVEASLNQLGYKLDAVSGSTWEFKGGSSAIFTFKHLYEIPGERAIEVHLLADQDGQLASDRLTRAEQRCSRGRMLASLAPADVFVQQAQHLFKHMCGEFTRASWVLEYWRHACAHRDDTAFWGEVERLAACEPGAGVAIGAATQLATLAFGTFVPEALRCWSMDQLSPAIGLWIQLYGPRLLLSDPPGNKLYLLLRKQLHSDSKTGRNERMRLLFPFHLPRRITRAQTDESPGARLRRYKSEVLFSIYRFRFHLAEGVRLAIEAPRWERRVAGALRLKSGYRVAVEKRLPLMAVAALAICLHGRTLAGQTITPPLPGGTPDASAAESTIPVADGLGSDSPTAESLTASQILSIIQNHPEILIELKELMAAVPSNGAPIQPDSISDEMLYSQITASKEFRQSVTIFLRSRGYLDDRDLRSAEPGRESSDSNESRDSNLIQRGSSSPAGADYDAEQMYSLAGNSRQIPPSLAENSPGMRNGARSQPENYGTTRQKADREDHRNITDQPQVLHLPTPYNLMSLRDLYTQLPDSAEPLKRFGSEVFTRRDRAMAGSVSLDVPIGPDYVLGPGDDLTIDLWGGISRIITRTVAGDGHLALLEAGDIQVAGLTLDKAQQLIQDALKKQYRDVQVSITISKLKAIRIYVVGDVQRPGAYEITSLSSPLNALYAAGGPTAVGSLRALQHYRGKQLLGTIDLYDFLLHGIREDDDRLQGGDTLVVPAAGPQVAVWGAVRRPAIYELKGNGSLAALLQDAGGLSVAASLQHISIERIDANRQRETISFGPVGDQDSNTLAMEKFEVKDGDRIHVAPIAPYSERVVYLEGHVVRPGRQPYREGMRLGDLLHSYQDLLPEPAVEGEIVRLVPPDLHVQTINFNVPDALIGNSNLPIQPFDTIRILGRYEVDAPRVEIRGEVLRPGSYPFSEGMTAAQLVRIAGGFKRDALVETADLISYRVLNGTKVEGERTDLHIGDAVDKGDTTADRNLKPGDVMTIHQITGWDDIGSSITIDGEVGHPGSYGFQAGERLSDVLRRAGGFRDTAYPAGAVLIRDQVRELEEKSRAELIRQIETSASAARLTPNIGPGEQTGQLVMIQQQQEQILSRLKSQPATGRLVIHITQQIDQWAGSPADIEVRRGDVLRIPKRPGFVLVSGQVYNESAITFAPGQSAGWYLQHAGGTTAAANRKEIFVIRANGSVVGRRSGEWFDRDVLSTRLQPGDVVVVPQKIIGASLFWRNLLSTAQIASSIAITAAVAGL
ncbi:MAG TPA: SLBB domain-containing protein [Terracidiphilus sp.]|jgi:protein involved in polysaccharide export with SLBB domain